MIDLNRRGNCEDLGIRVVCWSGRTKLILLYVGTTIIVSDCSMCNNT